MYLYMSMCIRICVLVVYQREHINLFSLCDCLNLLSMMDPGWDHFVASNMISSLLWLSSVRWSKYTTVPLSIHLLLSIWFVSIV